MKKPACIALFIILFGAIALPALAYNYPLSSEAIREAYFVGKRNDEQTSAFFAQYRHHFPMPKTGPDVDEIGLDTPFAQVAERAAGYLNQHAPEAEQEFLGKSMNFRVHVVIYLTPSYSPIPLSDLQGSFQWVPAFWSDFKVRLLQDKEIPARTVRGGPVYSYGDFPTVIGARIQLDYDAARIDPAPAKIEVLTPDGQDVATEFNLARLR